MSEVVRLNSAPGPGGGRYSRYRALCLEPWWPHNALEGTAATGFATAITVSRDVFTIALGPQ